MFDDNVKGGPSRAWDRLKAPARVLSPRPSPGQRSGQPRTPGGRRRTDPTKVHAVFGLLGLAVAAAGTVWAWALEHSIALSIYVFCMLAFYVGRGLGDVVTDRGKVRRFMYFSIYPVVGTGILVGAYRLWDIWWLAVLLGFLGGIIVWALLGAWWFPDIEVEENADTDLRFREARGR